MCYNKASKLTREENQSLENEYVRKWQEEEKPEDYYSVSGFSHPKIPVLTSDGGFRLLRWGLIPSWVKDWDTAKTLRVQTLNAISDTIDSKPSFRGAVKEGRFCIIPSNGFFEWHHHANGQKYPHFIYPKNQPFFMLAGLYERWENKALGETMETYTICTTAANERMEWIHNSKKRMPAILTIEESKIWLDKSVPFAEKKILLDPYDQNLMLDHPISRLITSRKENPNQPAVIEKVEYPELALST